MITLKFKSEISTLEIYGAEKLFNISFENEYGYEINEELFINDNYLNSTSCANGHPIQIQDYSLSHFKILKNGMLVAICYDENEGEHYFRIEQNNITELSVSK